MLKKLSPYILVVEDSDEDFEALQRVFTRNCNSKVPFTRVLDGEEALDFLAGDHVSHNFEALPSLILLDLNLPGSDGRDVLRQVKQDDTLKLIPVVVLTTSSDPKDIEACYRYGANSYLIKPMNLQQMKESICLVLDYWFKATVLPDSCTV